MTDIRLGELVTDQNQQRDAVHVAVIPLTAGQLLRPGDHAGIDPMNRNNAVANVDCIGIVDPLLIANVRKGQRFLLWLYPNTVTGMRHHWSHPAFNAVTEPHVSTEFEASVAWIKNASVRLGVRYETLIAEGGPLERDDYINNGEDIRDIWYEINDEFWRHHKIVTGRDVPEDDRGGFTCSC